MEEKAERGGVPREALCLLVTFAVAFGLSGFEAPSVQTWGSGASLVSAAEAAAATTPGATDLGFFPQFSGNISVLDSNAY